MKKIKTFLSIVFILAYINIHAQESSTNTKNSIYNFSLSTDFKQQDYSVDFTKIDFSKKEYLFTAYNNNSNLYDNYYIANNKFSFSNSNTFYTSNSNLFTDVFVENNTSTLPTNSLFMETSGRPVRDSFNPHGTNDMKKAILGGFLGLLFNK